MVQTVITTKINLDSCSFNCKYCYVTPENRVEQLPRDYDLDKILETMEKLSEEKEESMITLHGGEPSALHPDDLETLLQKSYELTGKSGLQTNGYLVDKYWDLFEEYNTHLSFSFDGPEECGQLRGYGSKENRIEQAKKVEANIREAMNRDIGTSIIAVIHRYNGIEYFDKFKDFLVDTELSGRLNPCKITSNISNNPDYLLNIKELLNVYDKLFEVCTNNGLDYSPFRDITNQLLDKKKVVCSFSNACDIYSTASLDGIGKNGEVLNCVKVYHDEEPYPKLKNPRPDIREQVLRETDCRNCKWFKAGMCMGGCPNSAMDEDWRRKTKYCALWYHLYDKIYNHLKGLGHSINLEKRSKCKSCGRKDRQAGNHRDSHNDTVKHLDGNEKHMNSSLR